MPRTFPLTAEQRSMLHMDRLLGPGILHNLLGSVELSPGTARHTVELALDRLAQRHPSLTATLTGDGSGGNQQTGQRAIEVRSADRAPTTDPDSRLTRLRHLRLDRSADARATAESDETGGRLILAVDHLVCDAAARELLLCDLSALLATGDFAVDARVPAQDYEIYCWEQDRALADERTRRQETDRWKRALQSCQPMTGLTPKAPDGVPREARCWEIHHSGPTLHDVLRHLARTSATSPFVVGAALYAIALWARTGARSSALVTPVSTRRAAQHERLVTNLVNERPIPYRISPDGDFTALAQSIGKSFLSALRCSALAIPDLVAAVDEYRELLHAPDCAYVQLQVAVVNDARIPVLPAGERTWSWGAPYAAPTGITCTVFRVTAAPGGTRLSTFHGGPTGQGAAVAALPKDVMRLAELAALDPSAPVGRLAECLC